MSCSNQACMNRECLNWSSILHLVSCTYLLFATTSWHFVSLYWEGKVLWTTQVTMLAGWLPFYFLHGRYLTSPKMKNSKVRKTQLETLHFLKNTCVFTELMSCLSRIVFETWNMGHSVMSHDNRTGNLTHLHCMYISDFHYRSYANVSLLLPCQFLLLPQQSRVSKTQMN